MYIYTCKHVYVYIYIYFKLYKLYLYMQLFTNIDNYIRFTFMAQ